MNNILANLKDVKTTIPAVLLLIAALPNNPIAQQVMATFPNAGKYILGAASVASGILLILGVKAAKE